MIHILTSNKHLILKEEHKGISIIIKEINWDIILFMMSIFIVVQGLRHTGAMDLFAYLFIKTISLPLLSVLIPSFIVTIGASIMNNWPMTILGIISIKQVASMTDLSSQHLTSLVFSNVIGNNLGPHFFPLGSLAILIWLEMLRSKGVNIRLVDYLKVGSFYLSLRLL